MRRGGFLPHGGLFVFGEIVIANLSISRFIIDTSGILAYHHSLQVIDTFLYKRRANKVLANLIVNSD